MLRELPSPVRAQVFCTLIVLAGVAASAGVSGVRSAGGGGNGVAVQVDPGDGPGRVILFDGPPDACAALATGGVRDSGCTGGGRSGAGSARLQTGNMVLETGAALFVMPDGGVRRGWMGGADLLALGIRIPVNAASAEDLEAIDGIGPSLALAIVADRVRSGSFRSSADLDRVKGIGPKKAAAIDRYVSYSPWPAREAPPSQ